MSYRVYTRRKLTNGVYWSADQFGSTREIEGGKTAVAVARALMRVDKPLDVFVNCSETGWLYAENELDGLVEDLG